MVESNSIECNSIESIEGDSIDTSNLNNQQFRLNKISEIEDYFITEIKERELMSKRFSKYIPFFDYFDKSLIFFINNKWLRFYCMVCNSYWNLYRSNKCKSSSCIFIVYRTCKKIIKSNKK